MDNILSVDQSTISSQDLPKYGYVYLTTNLVNGKKYVGAHRSSTFDESYKGSGKVLWRAINKYGWDNFKTEILKWCYSKEELFQEEFFEIERRDAVRSREYYNMMPGGRGGDNKTTLTPEEHQRYIQKIKDSKNRPRTQKEVAHMERLHQLQVGHPRSDESKQKSSESNRGQVRSEEAKHHMSRSHADFKGERNPFYSKHHSEESRRKISQNNARSHQGKIWITNKVDKEFLISPDDFSKYEGYVRGRLRKSQR